MRKTSNTNVGNKTMQDFFKPKRQITDREMNKTLEKSSFDSGTSENSTRQNSKEKQSETKKKMVKVKKSSEKI